MNVCATVLVVARSCEGVKTRVKKREESGWCMKVICSDFGRKVFFKITTEYLKRLLLKIIS